MALIVTGGGGLALIAGMLLLGSIAGSYELSTILERGDAIRSSPLCSVALALILLGAFTKSAQFPFHFWLPHAMAAPTPVSAYLHSAAMVKAGIFLLARLWPVFSGTEMWFGVVTGTGLATMLVGAWIALFRNDLKELLAFSTVSQLGLIVMLLGIGTPAAAVAAVFHIFNHALFKASLFMSAGIVDHEAGTRDMKQLGGLARFMPLSATLAIVAAAAMAGLPMLSGFLSKEMMLEQAGQTVIAGSSWLFGLLATAGALLSVAYALRLVASVYFGRARFATLHEPHEPPAGMWLPVAILVLPLIVIGVFPALAETTLERAAAAVIGVAAVPVDLAIWHGFTPALLMSMTATAGGIALLLALPHVVRWRTKLPRPEARLLYRKSLAGSVAAARWCTERLHTNELPRYVACMLTAVLAVCAFAFLGGAHAPGTREPIVANSVALVGSLVLAGACILTLMRHHDRLLLLILTGAAGLIVSLAFALFSAPDLALTQVSVEIVAVMLLLLALNRMPKTTPRETGVLKRSFDALLSMLAGVATAAAAYAVSTRNPDAISSYHLAQAKPAGGGTNVVNVILVDFRALDTFGEIIVLGIAGVAILALLDSTLKSRGGSRAAPMRDIPENGVHSPIVVVGTRLLLPLILTTALYIFLRGHNLPGGGFIAGIVVAIAFLMQYVASGYEWARSRAFVEPVFLIGGGILLAGLVGIGSWALGYPLLTSAHGELHVPWLGPLAWSSALLFDLGVFATVVGTVMVAVVTLSRVKAPVPDVSRDQARVSVPPPRAADTVASVQRRRERA